MSENKYIREVIDLDGKVAKVDIYTFLEAFDVRCPARQHAIKKLACSGIRGKGDTMQDLSEAGASNIRALQLERGRDELEAIKASRKSFFRAEREETFGTRPGTVFVPKGLANPTRKTVKNSRKR